jgi:hypothetical protein
VGEPQLEDDRVPRLGLSLKKLVDEQLAKGVSIEEHPVKRAISSQPVVKPIKITAPNSVFALGAAFTSNRIQAGRPAST